MAYFENSGVFPSYVAGSELALKRQQAEQEAQIKAMQVQQAQAAQVRQEQARREYANLAAQSGGITQQGLMQIEAKYGDVGRIPELALKNQEAEQSDLKLAFSMLEDSPEDATAFYNKTLGQKYGPVKYAGKQANYHLMQGADGSITAINPKTLEIKQLGQQVVKRPMGGGGGNESQVAGKPLDETTQKNLINAGFDQNDLHIYELLPPSKRGQYLVEHSRRMKNLTPEQKLNLANVAYKNKREIDLQYSAPIAAEKAKGEMQGIGVNTDENIQTPVPTTLPTTQPTATPKKPTSLDDLFKKHF